MNISDLLDDLRMGETSLDMRIKREELLEKKPNDNFYLLISGLTEFRHEENIALAYNTITALGVEKDNIYVLDINGASRIEYPVDGAATKRNLERVTQHLAQRIDGDDFLLIYVTNHGKRDWGTSSIVLNETEELDENEFRRYTNSINAKIGVMVFDQCYGGGFAIRNGRGNFIGISASRENETSKENTFPQAFFEAFTRASADMNGDHKISIREAFEYALKHDEHSRLGNQTPQMYYDGTAVSPDEIFLKNDETST